MSSTSLTCITCGVVFQDIAVMKQHYKTDWHRANLKRKVVGLSRISYEEFQKIEEKKKEKYKEKDHIYCKICRKTFACSKAFDNHLNSKKHKEALKNVDGSEEVRVKSVPANKKVDLVVKLNRMKEWDSIINRKKVSQENLMDIDDSLYNEEDIEDVDSDEWEEMDEEEEEDDGIFMEISDDNPILLHNCLFCDHHSNTMSKNLKHMSIVHSFFVPDIEYVLDMKKLLLYLGEKVCKFYVCLWCNTSGKQFYSMEAVQGHMKDKGHCKVLHEGRTLAEFEPFYNYSKSYPDYADGVDENEEVTIPDLDTDDFQLTLPSGSTIGHRSLVAYYKQYYSGDQTIVKKQSKLGQVLSTYRALGWTETDKQIVIKKAKDIKYMRTVQNKMSMRLGVKANKLQKHFREQVNF